MQRVYSQKEQFAESGFVPFAEGHLAESHWIVGSFANCQNSLDLPAILMARIRTDFPATTSVTTGYRVGMSSPGQNITKV
jgi:hypothetical protein